MKGISTDAYLNNVWVYSESGIYKVRIDKEDKNIWKVYLDRALVSGDSSDFGIYIFLAFLLVFSKFLPIYSCLFFFI